MNLLTRENEKSLLSAIRPVSKLQTDIAVKSQLQTKLRQKSIIKIYIADNKYYVEHSAAHALGLINTRAIMLDSPKLIEISSDIHNKLKSNVDMEIEYIKIEKKPLKVFADDTKFCITNSAAYALFAASSSLAGAADGLGEVTGVDDSKVGDYFYAPVKLDRHEEFSVNNFGSQISPFYLVLSMWVGALVTCVLLKAGSSIGTKYRPNEVYLGKLVLFASFSILQTTITLLGCYVLNIDIFNHPVFILTCYFVSLVFMTFVYSLISLFGDVGEGITIILLVFQISGTGGMYPVQIMNNIFGVIYPYLPMTHGINIVREAQLGLIWANYIPSFTKLLVFAMVVIFVSFILKERFDKRTKYFDEKLDDSGLFK